jgi:hypothetical protein
MKRALSLLLLVPFLTTQAWALLGGPFDGINGRSQAALAGTYGVILSGNVLNDSDPKKEEQPVNPETTGIMALSVPNAGMATGRVLVFAQGLMYLGNAQGLVDRRNGKVSLVSQVSHYVARAVSDGITTRTGVTIDAILSGKMNLSMSLDYMSGLIELDGSASYYRSKTLQTELALVNQTIADTENKAQVASENANASKTASALQSESADTTDTKGLNQSANSTTTNVVTNPDGSATSTTDTTGTTANNVSGTSTNSNSLSSDSRDSNINKNSTLASGSVTTTTTTKTKYDVALVEAKPIKLAFMDLRATGVRQDTTVEPIAPFTPPSQATGFQIEVAAPTTGGGAPRAGN